MDYIKALKKLVPKKLGLETFTDEEFSGLLDSLKSHGDKNINHVQRYEKFNTYRYLTL